MPHYHLFYLKCEDSRAIDSAVFQAADDKAAVALVAQGGFPLPLELWSGYERIRRFERSAAIQAAFPAACPGTGAAVKGRFG